MPVDEQRYVIAGPDAVTTVVGATDLTRRLAEAEQAGVCVAWRQTDPTDQSTATSTSDVADDDTDGA